MVNNNMKFLLIGYARSGKDTAAEYLRENFGITFSSSSMSACNIFLFDKLKDKYGYTSPTDCFNDRDNHREEWFNLIKDYNKDDRARLAKEILRTSNCYVGMRSRDEFNECIKQNIFDLIIWIDGEERVGKEEVSCELNKYDADVIIDSNQGPDELYRHLDRLFNKFYVSYDIPWMFR